MRSMKMKAFLDVSTVEISFNGAGPNVGGARVTARVNIHQSVGGKPHVHANPNSMALSWQGSLELVEKVKELIEREGFEAMIGSYDSKGDFQEMQPSHESPRERGRTNPVGEE